LIACFLSNISAKYYENPTMLLRVIAKNIGDVFFETQCSYIPDYICSCTDLCNVHCQQMHNLNMKMVMSMYCRLTMQN